MAKQPLIETTDLNIKMEAATEEINLFPENDAEEKQLDSPGIENHPRESQTCRQPCCISTRPRYTVR